MCAAGRGTTVEVLAFLGAFGLFWAGLQAAALELGELRALRWTPEVCAPDLALQPDRLCSPAGISGHARLRQTEMDIRRAYPVLAHCHSACMARIP